MELVIKPLLHDVLKTPVENKTDLRARLKDRGIPISMPTLNNWLEETGYIEVFKTSKGYSIEDMEPKDGDTNPAPAAGEGQGMVPEDDNERAFLEAQRRQMQQQPRPQPRTSPPPQRRDDEPPRFGVGSVNIG